MRLFLIYYICSKEITETEVDQYANILQVCTLIPCRLFSTLSFAAVQVKSKCYETTQNMEDTYPFEIFFFTWNDD